MKKYLKIRIVGTMLVVLIAAAVGTALRRPYNEGHVTRDADSRAFAEASMWAIAGKWDPEAMLMRADPAIVNTSLRNLLPGAYARLAARYGTLQKLGALTGQTDAGGATVSPYTVHSLPGEGGSIATWSADAQFEKGPARIELVMRRHGDAWNLLGFRVDPPGPPRATS